MRAALREDVVRQFRAAEKFSARLSSHAAIRFPRNRAKELSRGSAKCFPISERGGFYASQDADQTLDDDGDYFTWTLDEARAVLTAEEARVVGALLRRRRRAAKCIMIPKRNVLWIASTMARTRQAVQNRRANGARHRSRQRKAAGSAALTPSRAPVDETLYVAWNSMFVSAYLEAARVLGRTDCRDFALKTLDRILAEAWDADRKDSCIGSAGRAWKVRSTIRCSPSPRCSTRGKRRSTRATSRSPSKPCGLLSSASAIPKAADSSTAPRTPRRWVAWKFAASRCRIRPRRREIPWRPLSSTACTASPARSSIATGRKNARSLRVLAPKYGLFAATYGLAALLHARHPLQVVVTGEAGDPKTAELKSRERNLPLRQSALARDARADGFSPSSTRAPRNAAASERAGHASARLRRDNLPSLGCGRREACQTPPRSRDTPALELSS